jgi:hypothetical protein
MHSGVSFSGALTKGETSHASMYSEGQGRSAASRAIAKPPKLVLKPLSADRAVVDHWHSVVNAPHQCVWVGRDYRERVQHITRVTVKPRVPQPGERERLFVLQVNPDGDSSVSFPSPFIKSIGGDNASSF